MPSVTYHLGGSAIVTSDSGEELIVPPGSQAEMDAAIQAHVGPQPDPEPTLEEQVADMKAKQDTFIALLVSKNVVSDVEVAAAIEVDAADKIKLG